MSLRPRSAVYRISRWILLVGVVVGLMHIPPTPAQGNTPTNQTTLYLPLIHTRYQPPRLGIEMRSITYERGLDLASNVGNYWVRRNALLWRFVEPEEGQEYDWSDVRTQTLESDLKIAEQLGMEVILIVRSNPRWAIAPYRSDCAPINPSKYQAFADFMAAAVERYSRPPYNVRYWEIGNEPDAYVFPNHSGFGCWGIPDDPYYGGRAYGEMLKVVVPAMRAVNPEIKILNGGLLLDRPYDAETGANHSARFLEGVFVVGAGPMFDILSYHHYIEYQSANQNIVGEEDWKIAYLRDMMQRYNIPEKPLFKTETAVLCRVITPECQWAQADAVPRFYLKALREHLLGVLWYHYDGDSYHNTGMIDASDGFAMPRPSFFAYRHAVRMLNDAQFERELSNLPANVEAYRLRQGTGTLIVGWANQPTSHTISIPPGAQVTCTDRDGGVFACPVNNGRLTVEFQRSPIYIQY